jgi:hypothetical protein
VNGSIYNSLCWNLPLNVDCILLHYY